MQWLKAPQFNKAYHLLEELMTFEKADSYCKRLGGRLLTIQSKEENDFVNQEVAFHYEVWLGAINSSTYRWQDGSTIKYCNWAKDSMEPLAGNGLAFVNSQGDWLTTTLDDGWWVVCEKAFNKKDYANQFLSYAFKRFY